MDLKYALLVALFCSGCTASDPDPSSPGLNPLFTPEAVLIGSDCEGAISLFAWPRPVEGPGAEQPPGWVGGGGVAGSAEYLHFFECSRFKVGNLERPLTILWETHSNHAVPEQCFQGTAVDRVQILVAAWVSDQEVANYLRNVWEMPVWFAEIRHDRTEQDGVVDDHWEWRADGYPGWSYVDFKGVIPGNSTFSFVERFAYFNENLTRVRTVDLIKEILEDNLEPPINPGMTSEPMMHNSAGTSYWLGQGAYADATSMNGKMTKWMDLECQAPESFS